MEKQLRKYGIYNEGVCLQFSDFGRKLPKRQIFSRIGGNQLFSKLIIQICIILNKI